jgi:hypothetical protein
MSTQSRKVTIKSILRNPLADKLESKHGSSILKFQNIKKSLNSNNSKTY